MYVNLPYPIKAMTAPKIPPTTFRFQPQVKASLMFISDRDGRSMANMLEWLIKQHCEREGLGWPPKRKKSPDTGVSGIGASSRSGN